MADLGEKLTCSECGRRYYSMHRPAPACPKCGEAFNPIGMMTQYAQAILKAQRPEETIDEDEEQDDVAEIDLDTDLLMAPLGGHDGDDLADEASGIEGLTSEVTPDDENSGMTSGLDDF